MKKTPKTKVFLAVAACAIAAATAAMSAQQVALTDWATVQNARYGFVIAYPASIFSPAPAAGASEIEGQVFVSRDGAAKLVIATFENEGGVTMDEYRQQILQQNYAGAKIDFAPVRRKWFIVSGTRGTMHFYERVSFTCSGRLITSWALIYPADQRKFYDRVVEAVAPTYAPGAGRTGQCD
jgi:hypothetical protein